MPITHTKPSFKNGSHTYDPPAGVEVTFAGRVLEVVDFNATRNMSDTLDYTDFRTVPCRNALVYRGRFGRPDAWSMNERDLEVHERFTWVDCSNHFTWRGADLVTAEVDADMSADTEMAEDYAAWKAHTELQARIAEVKAKVRKIEEAKRAAELERNRPVRGKSMIVSVRSGKNKAHNGKVGVVFWVREDRVGLDVTGEKDAKGYAKDPVWVNASQLRAVVQELAAE